MPLVSQWHNIFDLKIKKILTYTYIHLLRIYMHFFILLPTLMFKDD